LAWFHFQGDSTPVFFGPRRYRLDRIRIIRPLVRGNILLRIFDPRPQRRALLDNVPAPSNLRDRRTKLFVSLVNRFSFQADGMSTNSLSFREQADDQVHDEDNRRLRCRSDTGNMVECECAGHHELHGHGQKGLRATAHGAGWNRRNRHPVQTNDLALLWCEQVCTVDRTLGVAPTIQGDAGFPPRAGRNATQDYGRAPTNM